MLADIHPIPAHALALLPESPHAPHPREAYELFASVAAGPDGGAVKLWDLRWAQNLQKPI